MEHFVPQPTDQRFYYANWVKANVRPGDTVVFPPGAVYWTETVGLLDAPPHRVLGNGATFLTKFPPPPPSAGVWKSPFDIGPGCDGVEIYDLNIKGPRPAGTSYKSAYEGQHGFSVHGATNTILCRCGTEGVYGDHFYVSGGARNVIICDPRSPTQSGRHGVAVTDAEDVLVFGGTINALRTLFNFEVHEDEHVRRFKAEGVKGHWTLRAITGTGEGEASDIEFKNISSGGTHKLSIEVYGTGQPGTRAYGPRNNWRIDGFRGTRFAGTTQLTDDPPDGAKVYVKLHYINGLAFLNVPGAGYVSIVGTS